MLKESYRRLRKIKWRIDARSGFLRYRATTNQPRLQIGGGPNVLSGWFNTDLYPWRAATGLFHLDATKSFPFPSESFHHVFTEHVIEHLERADALRMLAECRRVLKRGGRIRVSCPNLETIAGLYLTPRTAQQESYMREVIDRFQPGERSLPGYVVNQLFDLGHQFLYDGETLQEALNRAGFVNVVPERPGASADPVFSGIDAHGGDYIAFESLILEAERPG